MKNLAVISLMFLFAISAEAQIKNAYGRVKQAVTGTAKISQPHYSPSQWEFLFSAAAEITKIDVNVKSVGLTVSKYKNTQQNLKADFILGLTDNLNVGLEGGYTSNKYSYSLPAGPGDESMGVTDPTLKLVFRAADLAYATLDFNISFQPSLGDSKVGDATHEGNGLYGGSTAALGAKIVFLATPESQIYLSGEYKSISKRKLLDQTANEVSEIDAHTGSELQVGVLTEIKQDVFFGLNYAGSNEDSADTTNLSTNQKNESQALQLKTVHLVAKYEFTPDSNIEGRLGHLLDGNSKGDGFDADIEANSFGLKYLVRF